MEQNGVLLKTAESGFMLYATWIWQLPQGFSMPSAEHLNFLSILKTWAYNFQIHDMLMQQISVNSSNRFSYK